MRADNSNGIAGKILESSLHNRCIDMSEVEIMSEFDKILDSVETSISDKARNKWRHQMGKPGKTKKIFLLNNIVLGFENLNII